MRPIQFILLLSLFVALPLVLTCFSLVHSAKASSEPLGPSFRPRQSRIRALFSFTTPSSLFPPSAVISLTNDNSTFFLARPAAFGPSLPSHGLSGQLWVGKGFGEELLLSDGIRIHGYELGCSDVPGWNEEHRHKIENGAIKAEAVRTARKDQRKSKTHSKSLRSKRNDDAAFAVSDKTTMIDGTDDHLHEPLPESNSALHTESGEPANADPNRGPAAAHADIESLQESADIAGKIVMLSRGGCGFLEKVKWAQRRGSVGLIVGDNQPGGQLTIMYAKGDTSNVSIPSLFTSYNAAHLLSSLVPPEKKAEDNNENSDSSKITVAGKPKAAHQGARQRGNDAAHIGRPGSRSAKISEDAEHDDTWVQNVLSAVGLSSEESDLDDSRRPPSSGNIDWVLVEDWDEDNVATSSSSSSIQKSTAKSTATMSKGTTARSTAIKRVGNDDFVIGVQDWRDTELIAPKATPTSNPMNLNGKQERMLQQMLLTSTAKGAMETARKEGIITPGSGEYGHKKHASNAGRKQKHRADRPSDEVLSEDRRSMRDKFRAFFYDTHERAIIHPKPKDDRPTTSRRKDEPKNPHSPSEGQPNKNEGLWVTLTPTSVSTSPFFDTLLVLVVSPLVTLTVVYGLLLLRSRIRRRRWRAPKSIVDQLPVRTYHTMSATSSAISSNAGTPDQSTNTSPQLRPSSARPRPRSQTTTGVVTSTPEKNDSQPKAKKFKRYTGRQIECCVCLEEYVDGESKVMSLPCGHEFHADCITPWLITRRRTCPICKGDVVRSFAYNTQSTDRPDLLVDEHSRLLVEQTSDDVQDRAAATVNDDASAAIPIPSRDSELANGDVERGDNVTTPLLGTVRSQTAGWRRSLGASISRLSGDTLWRNSSGEDRNR